jgi:hypothetical protein
VQGDQCKETSARRPVQGDQCKETSARRQAIRKNSARRQAIRKNNEYGAEGSIDDVLNRVQSVHDDDLTVLAEFQYI